MDSYPVEFEPDDDTVMAIVPDLPGCRTFGDTEADALRHAVGAVRAMISGLMDERRDIPPPSPAEGRPTVRLPVLDALKLRLYQELRARGVSQSDLARRLGKSPKDVWRLLDLTHASRMDQIEAAFAALGLVIEPTVRDAA
ncbi:type II toxin-antitoxin system HicB family antitoxin [uncultured Rhodospira sp.]|mgnify:CR=1 FL=1|uniref:type II toxin-antitoxin system HicB family antitoxin n=1 Tax=uncultured Rhodospira sp. TaxID=1936189 RepID=UPI002623C71D|nr:type II toxin-antitoxin system HicB family antitoxin [uncultured Rhodospira sp.]